MNLIVLLEYHLIIPVPLIGGASRPDTRTAVPIGHFPDGHKDLLLSPQPHLISSSPHLSCSLIVLLVLPSIMTVANSRC